MSASPPSTIGHYQIIREIARSNDIVYEAYDPNLNRRVALKELAMPGGATQQQREDRARRFEREAKAVGGLSHPNIVTVFEYAADGERHYIAMEYLEGHTLRNELDTHGFLPVDRSLSIIKEVLSALDYAHKHGVIHRDIKPENIQLLPDGRVKLTDFGIARLTFEPNLTMDGQVFGTPSYMSPEQVVGKEIDARSDVFSVGVVLYEMLAGQKPFSGDSVVSTTYAIMNVNPPQPNQANHLVWQVLSTALDKSPALRYSTSIEMFRAVEIAERASLSVVLDAGGQLAPDPYGQPVAPPIANPYVQPGLAAGGFQPGFPGATYPPGGGTQQPYAQQFVPLPIYYPPPPRGPLISPETKQFFGKLILTVIVLGTLFALVVVVINGLGIAWQRARAQQDDLQIRAKIDAADSKLPIEQRIQRTSEAIGKLKDPVSQNEERRNLAVLYEQKGKSMLIRSNLQEAERAFRQAQELDPTNAAYASDLGNLFARQALASQLPRDRLELWSESILHWSRAVAYERDSEKKRLYEESAARAHYDYAAVLRDVGELARAREALYAGRNLAAPDSATGQAIERLLEELSR